MLRAAPRRNPYIRVHEREIKKKERDGKTEKRSGRRCVAPMYTCLRMRVVRCVHASHAQGFTNISSSGFFEFPMPVQELSHIDIRRRYRSTNKHNRVVDKHRNALTRQHFFKRASCPVIIMK